MSDGLNREALLAEYFRLTRETLPARATGEGWVVRNDHCFQRILLDHACAGPWRERLPGRGPAYARLSDAELAATVKLARRIDREGDALLRELNSQSLRWRGKGMG